MTQQYFVSYCGFCHKNTTFDRGAICQRCGEMMPAFKSKAKRAEDPADNPAELVGMTPVEAIDALYSSEPRWLHWLRTEGNTP